MYANIVDGVVLAVGDLPAFGVTLGENRKLIADLSGTNASWAVACGWYDVDHPELLDELDIDGPTRAAIDGVIEAALETREGRVEFVDDTMVTLRDLSDQNTAWLSGTDPVVTAPFPTDSTMWAAFLADLLVWQEWMRNHVFSLTLQNNFLFDVLLLVIPTLTELLEQAGIGQVVTMRVVQAPEFWQPTSSMEIG